MRAVATSTRCSQASAMAPRGLKTFLKKPNVKLVGTGEYFGERALLTAEPRSADVLARTGVSLVSLTRQEPPTLNPKP